MRLLLNQVKYSKETYKRSFKKRAISHLTSQSLAKPIIGKAKSKTITDKSEKETPPLEETADKEPASAAKQSESLQVEEIDKKIEEILNQ